MARIRTIKPEFFTSEDIVSLSPLARILYIATWCEADKEGRLVWKPRTFKMRYLPGDDCDIDAVCAELVSARLVILYGDGFAYIPGFSKHQHVNPRESKSVLPAPDGYEPAAPKRIPKDVREQVMERDGGACVRCGSDDHVQLDHILPQSCGGPHIAENLRVLCRSCNAGRPVSGPSLEKDLAADGYSLQSLRVKFGIDASIPDVHAQGGREGKGSNTPLPPKGESASPPGEPPGFARFWSSWPKSTRKGGKAACLKAWARGRLEAQADAIVAHVAAMALTADWRKNAGEFIPAPLVYLNQRRWDGAESGPSQASTLEWAGAL